jgi:COMPASS component SWD3
VAITRVSNTELYCRLGDRASGDEKLPIGCLRYARSLKRRWRPKLTGLKERLVVTGGTDGVLSYWNSANGKLVASVKPPKRDSDILCLDYTRDATRVAASGKRRAIRLYDDEKRALVCKLRNKGQALRSGHTNRVTSLKFDDTGKLLVSGSWDMTVKVWDVTSGTVAHSIFGPEIAGDAIDIRDDLILTGSHRSKDSLQVWSLSYGKLVETIEWDSTHPGDSSLIFSSQFEKGGSSLLAACGSGRNEARIFERAADRHYSFAYGVVGLPSTCSSLDFSSKDNYIAIGCCDGVCRLFERVPKERRDSHLFSEPATPSEAKAP